MVHHFRSDSLRSCKKFRELVGMGPFGVLLVRSGISVANTFRKSMIFSYVFDGGDERYGSCEARQDSSAVLQRESSHCSESQPISLATPDRSALGSSPECRRGVMGPEVPRGDRPGIPYHHSPTHRIFPLGELLAGSG